MAESLKCKLNWFHSLGPQNEMNFCSLNVWKKETSRFLGVSQSQCNTIRVFVNKFERYLDERPLAGFCIIVTVLVCIVDPILNSKKCFERHTELR